MKKKRFDKDSWIRLFKFYTKIKIPWGFLILSSLLSFGLKKAEVMVVPYTSKIMTGEITEHGFLMGFILMTSMYAIIEALQETANDLAGLTMTRNARRGILYKIINLPMSFFGKEEPQRLVSRITQDTEGTLGAVNALILFASTVYGIYISFKRMYLTYKSLSLIMLSGIPIAIVSTLIVGKLNYQIEKINNDAISANTNFFAERLPSVFHIKTSNMEDEELRKGIAANDERYRQEIKKENRFIISTPISSFAQYFNEIILLVVASALVRAGTMEMYHVVNLYNYYMIFMSNAFMLTATWQAVKTSHGTAETISKIMDAEEEDLVSGEYFDGEPEDIRFENVSFTYDGKRQILDNASFLIPKGKVTAIVGENGCGKSTVIKLIEGFNDVNAGTIRVGERKLCDLNLASWRKSVGYLFQGNQMIKGTIKENIAYGIDRDYTMDEVIEASKLANAYDFINEKENGFDTEINNYESKCSGGEMQRIAVARILMKKPDYLIMDEATSGIDVINEKDVIRSLREAMKDRTVIMVSHDMKMIKSADHIVVLADGSVEASGDFDTVAKESSKFREFMAADAI